MSKFFSPASFAIASITLALSSTAYSAETVVPESRGDCPDGYRSYKRD
jgi:hypothetical protein